MTLTRTFTSETFRISTLWSYYSFCSRILHRQGNRKGGEGRWGRGKQSSSQSFVHIDFHWNIHYPHLPGSLQIQGFSAVLSHDSGIEFFFFFNQTAYGAICPMCPTAISFLGLVAFLGALWCTVFLCFWDT